MLRFTFRRARSNALVLASAKLLFGQVASLTLFSVFTLQVARRLSVSHFGLFGGLYGVALLSTDVSDFGTGIHYVITAMDYSSKELKRRMDVLLTQRLVAHLLAIAPWLTVAFLVVPTIGASTAVAAAVVALPLSIRNTLQAEFRVKGHYGTSAGLQVVERTLALVSLIVISPHTVAGALISLTLGSAIAVGPVLVWRGTRVTLCGIGHMYRDALPYGVVSLISDLGNIEIPLVSAFAGPIQAGLFTVPSRLLSPLSLVGSAVGTAVIREGATAHKDRVHAMVWWAALGSSVIVGSLAVAIGILAPDLVDSLLGRRFSGAVLPTQIACLSAVLVTAAQPLASGLQARRRGRLASAYVLAQMMLYLAFVSVGAALDGAIGAAVGATVGSALGLLIVAALWQAMSPRLQAMHARG